MWTGWNLWNAVPDVATVAAADVKCPAAAGLAVPCRFSTQEDGRVSPDDGEMGATERLLFDTQPANMEEAMRLIADLRSKLDDKRKALDESGGFGLDWYFSTPLLGHLRQRLPWLMGLLLLESTSAYSLGHFQSMIDRHMTLALFCPMIVGTAGNAGNQPGIIFTRAVSTGEFNVRKGLMARFFMREFILALIVASVMCFLGFVRTTSDHGDDMMSCVAIALTLFFVILLAIGSGLGFSLLLHYLGCDPATGAAPLLTTLSDVVGVLLLCCTSSFIFWVVGRPFAI